jgi:glucose-6-phosphate 1-epimerase
LLWLSRASLFAEGRAIRGGVPVCWPWFGRHPDNPDLPQHGFARTSLWRLVEVDESDPDLSVVTLELQDCAQTLELWPHHFILRLRIGVGRSLELALTTMNRDRESCTITSALHSYFTVSDIDNVEIRGLENTPYFDALTGENRLQQGAIHICREVDRVYQEVDCRRIELFDRERIVEIRPQGSRSAVVWNPWIAKSAAMADMEPEGYKTMVCIETANALDDARTLAPGDSHTLGVTIQS